MVYTVRIHGMDFVEGGDEHTTFKQQLSNFHIDDNIIETEFVSYYEGDFKSWTDSHNPSNFQDISIADFIEFTYDTDKKTHDKIFKYLSDLDKTEQCKFYLLECKETGQSVYGSYKTKYEGCYSIFV